MLVDQVGMNGAFYSPVWFELTTLTLLDTRVETTGGYGSALHGIQGYLYLGGLTGNAANIPEYGLRSTSLLTTIINPDVSITGGINDTFFTQTSTANAWPTAPASITDGAGSLITAVTF